MIFTNRFTLLASCLVVVLLSAGGCTSISPPDQTLEIERLQEEYNAHVPSPPKLMLLGTFHFEGSVSDARSAGNLGMLAEKRQQEIKAVVERLSTYNPTIIAIEAGLTRQNALDERYAKYAAGDYQLTANEIDQIGLRLAKQLGLDRVHAIDAKGRWLEGDIDGDEFAKEHGQEEWLGDPVENGWDAFKSRMENLASEQPLRDHLLIINNPDILKLSHSIYLTRKQAITNGEDYPFADGFVSQWYNRNIRIFGNILGLAQQKDARILVVIGSGHVPILRHLAENSGGVDLIEVSDFLAE